MNVLALILAAGKGMRMKSSKPKVLFESAGKPMIDYVINAAAECADSLDIVVGGSAEEVTSHVGDRASFSVQKSQKGTGDAVLAAAERIKESGRVLILCGDMPLVRTETLRKFMEVCANEPVGFISVEVKNPSGYGRVVRGAGGGVIRITEEKDAAEAEKKIKEINTGIYYCDSEVLLDRLSRVGSDNAQKEYYLTDIVKEGAFAFKAADEKEFIGVNNRAQLAEASKVFWRRRADKFTADGVNVLDPDTLYADEEVVIECDAEIMPNVYLHGKTVIRTGSVIGSGCRITDSEIGENCAIKDNCFITESKVGAESSVGPMAHLRPGTVLKGHNKIGNFVETKKAVLGEGTKASHLTYLGDADIGSDVNIGCGTITCNYDGISKYKTIIEDGVFVGSDVQLVAPVRIGKDALIAAGSTITKDVPGDALAITRADQVNREGWVSRWKKAKGKGK
jgi:bifunctional UDP-N-acetylglucosamine pyrophosphorylase/glucosamine-1-phosphate N-acetyltransferase